MKAAIVSVFVLVLGMLFASPVAAARPISSACPIPVGPSPATMSPQCTTTCTPTLTSSAEVE